MFKNITYYPMKIVILKKDISNIFALIGFVIFFFLSLYLVKSYSSEIQEFITQYGYRGMIMYVFLVILSVVIAPVSTIPLLPVATAAWGPFWAGVLSILAWFLGSVIAFFLGRYVGNPILATFINMTRFESVVRRISSVHLFWSIVLLRIALPVDVLSYAIGLMTKVPFKVYAGASFIGIIPMAFLLSYAVASPIWLFAVIIFFVYLILYFINITMNKYEKTN